jgi:GT2 family glycosyltransferase
MVLDTVRSILYGRHVPRELIVVDQSTEPNRSLKSLGNLRGCEVRYVRSRARGVARARNVGLRCASQDVVVMVDDDMLVSDDWLARLLAGLTGGDSRTVATGRVLAAPPDGPGLAQAPAALYERAEPAVFRGRQPIQVVPGPNFAAARSVMAEIGGYDERIGPGTRFPTAEDMDISLRLLDAGCEVRHVPEAVVWHRSWRSPRDLVRLRWGYARGVGGFYAKHASLHDRYGLARAAREVRTRAHRAAGSVFSSPWTTAAELVSLVGIACGAIEWTLRYRIRSPVLSRRP